MKKNSNLKIIFHIDLNAFFANCAILENPKLKGKAFAIGRENSTKGVISTASYEARKFGVNSGMSLVDAFRRCPNLIVVNPDFHLYKDYSHKFFDLLREYSNILEIGSIDEGYLDVTELCETRRPYEIAKEIQTRLLQTYNLPCSIGISTTLFLAKMASDIKKPLGITVIRKVDIEKILYPLDVKDIFGIGKKTYPLLHLAKVHTIGDFMDPKFETKICELIGRDRYLDVKRHILGYSSNEVVPNRFSKNESVSTSETFDTPLQTLDEVKNELSRLCSKLYERLIKYDDFTKTITITLRNTNFKTITRSYSLDYTQDFDVILYHVKNLATDNYLEEPLRLVGVGFSNLKGRNDLKHEITLFNYEEFESKEDAVKNLLKNLNEKYDKVNLSFGIKKDEEK